MAYPSRDNHDRSWIISRIKLCIFIHWDSLKGISSCQNPLWDNKASFHKSLFWFFQNWHKIQFLKISPHHMTFQPFLIILPSLREKTIFINLRGHKNAWVCIFVGNPVGWNHVIKRVRKFRNSVHSWNDSNDSAEGQIHGVLNYLMIDSFKWWDFKTGNGFFDPLPSHWAFKIERD